MRPRLRHFVSAVLLLAALMVRAGAAAPADDQYAVAAGHYSRGNWQLAVEEFGEFLKANPQHPKASLARFFEAEALVQLGKYDEAQARFRDFIQAEPNHAYAKQALFRQGEAAFMGGAMDDAKKALDQFRQTYPSDPLQAYVLPYLGEIALTANDGPTAELLFSEHIQKFGKPTPAAESRFGLAKAQELKGDVENAARTYKSLIADVKSPLADDASLQLGMLLYRERQYTEAGDLLASFSTNYPKSELEVKAKYWLGLSQLANRKFAAAIDTFDVALNSAPKMEPLAPALEFYLAEALRQAGKANEAAAHYDHILTDYADTTWADDALLGRLVLALQASQHDQIDQLAVDFERRFPTSELRPRVRRVLARSQLKRAKYAEAQVVLADLVKSPPGSDDGTNWYYLALSYLGGEKYPEAREALTHVRPTEAQTDLAAGVLLARAGTAAGLGEQAQAVEDLQTYLKNWPTAADAPKARSDLAIAFAKMKRFPEARAAATELTKIKAPQALTEGTQLYVGNMAYEAGEIKEARELFTELSQPGHSEETIAKALAGIAWCQLKTGSTADSAATFDKLLKDHSSSGLAPEAALARAKSLEKISQHEQALATYRLVIDKYPDSPKFLDAVVGAVRLHSRLQQYREAAELAQRVADDERFQKRKDFDGLLYEWAWVLNDSGKPADALTVFGRLHEGYQQSSFWADATYRLAVGAKKANQYDEATKYVDEILQTNAPADVISSALYLQGEIAVSAERWADVVAPMERLVKEYPTSPLSLPAEYWIAESFYRRKDYAEAGKRFEKLLKEIEGKDTDAQGQRIIWLAMIPLRVAQVALQETRWSDAYTLAAGIGERFPNFKQQYEADFVLARCLANDAKFDEARAAYARVVAAGGKTETAAIAQWMTGESFFHQKRYEEAVRAYLKVEILYDYPEWRSLALLQAGKCYEVKGQWAQAQDAYQRIAKQYGQTTSAKEAAVRLREVETRGGK